MAKATGVCANGTSASSTTSEALLPGVQPLACVTTIGTVRTKVPASMRCRASQTPRCRPLCCCSSQVCTGKKRMPTIGPQLSSRSIVALSIAPPKYYARACT
eukprot:scaffold132927_cov60-Phaeocystis_antarctica.AAC.3